MARSPKSASTGADVFAMPSVDATQFVDQFRTYAEKSVAQSQEAYAKMKETAEEAQKTLESTMEAAQAHSKVMALKMIDTARTSMNASLSHMEALLGVKTVAEAIEMQSAFFRKQAEAAVDQAKDFQAMSTKAVEEVSAPAKAAVEKAVEQVKVAA